MTANDQTPAVEIEERHRRLRGHLGRLVPDAEGILVFSRLNIFYLTGSLATGLLWLPREGEPVLLSRRGFGRARSESPLATILSFRSFREVASLCADAGSPLGDAVAVEKNGLSWSRSELLQRHLPGPRFLSGDAALARTRAVKSEWELEHIRLAGSRHAVCLETLLPPLLGVGMTESKISHRLWDIFFAQGHQGLMRLENFGEEIFLGHVAAGVSGNFPSTFNGPVGLLGVHPSSPSMGSPRVVWQAGEPLTVDCGFCIAGYHTDKTQVYWSGEERTVPAGVRKAHDFCVELQGDLARQLVPGAVPSELASFAFDRASAARLAAGFMALGENKVPFVGHGIGLAIDEFPAIAEGFDEPLAAGMVIALEPKVGIEGVGIVGTENTFEVTAAGGRCLTGNIFGMIPVLRAP